MAQGKMTPRQKMINMMYLVLTALLALNVSKEIINAFVTVNESLVVSKKNIVSKNNTTYEAFAVAMQNDPKKYGEVNNQAQLTKKTSDAMVTYIDDLKNTLIRKTEELKETDKIPELRAVESKDNYDIPTEIMCGQSNDGKGAKASELKAKIESYKTEILKIFPAEVQTDFKKKFDELLNTQDPESNSIEYLEDNKRTWEMAKFYHNPVVASIALLTKFEGDVRNTESQVIDHLFQSVDKKIVKFDVLTPKVIPNSTVVTIGSEYQADVFLSATSSTLAPDVFIGATTDATGTDCKGCDGKPLVTDGGVAKYTDRPGSEGEKKWSGVIRVKKPDNTYQYFQFNSSYVAQKPNSVVSADKMNVLYIGVDNPMSISVPGISNDKVRVSIDGGGGALKSNPQAGGGHYIATVATIGKATIKVSAEIGGKVLPMGNFEYRIKRVPDPVAQISNSKGGGINKNLLAAGTLIPILENFDFELFFRIISFRITVIQRGKDPIEIEGQGNQLTQQMRDLVAKLPIGSKIYFEYIKAKMATGADQSTRSLSPMSFTIQ